MDMKQYYGRTVKLILLHFIAWNIFTEYSLFSLYMISSKLPERSKAGRRAIQMRL